MIVVVDKFKGSMTANLEDFYYIIPMSNGAIPTFKNIRKARKAKKKTLYSKKSDWLMGYVLSHEEVFVEVKDIEDLRHRLLGTDKNMVEFKKLSGGFMIGQDAIILKGKTVPKLHAEGEKIPVFAPNVWDWFRYVDKDEDSIKMFTSDIFGRILKRYRTLKYKIRDKKSNIIFQVKLYFAKL